MNDATTRAVESYGQIKSKLQYDIRPSKPIRDVVLRLHNKWGCDQLVHLYHERDGGNPIVWSATSADVLHDVWVACGRPSGPLRLQYRLVSPRDVVEQSKTSKAARRPRNCTQDAGPRKRQCSAQSSIPAKAKDVHAMDAKAASPNSATRTPPASLTAALPVPASVNSSARQQAAVAKSASELLMGVECGGQDCNGPQSCQFSQLQLLSGASPLSQEADAFQSTTSEQLMFPDDAGQILSDAVHLPDIKADDSTTQAIPPMTSRPFAHLFSGEGNVQQMLPGAHPCDSRRRDSLPSTVTAEGDLDASPTMRPSPPTSTADELKSGRKRPFGHIFDSEESKGGIATSEIVASTDSNYPTTMLRRDSNISRSRSSSSIELGGNLETYRSSLQSSNGSRSSMSSYSTTVTVPQFYPVPLELQGGTSSASVGIGSVGAALPTLDASLSSFDPNDFFGVGTSSAAAAAAAAVAAASFAGATTSANRPSDMVKVL
eukprot:SAG31_NODE_1039_length_10212_cov_8.897063_1_plen_489_part_00